MPDNITLCLEVEAVCCERLPHKIPGHLLMGESPPSGSDGSLSQAHMFLTKSSMIAPSPQGTSNASSFSDPSTPCCAKSEHTVITSSVCEQRGHHERQCPPFPSVTSSCCTAVRAPVSSCNSSSSGCIKCTSRLSFIHSPGTAGVKEPYTWRIQASVSSHSLELRCASSTV